MKVSVIVPIYKVEAYLDKCIESIVEQTYTDLEIILVDDGSPDNCPTICDAWVAKDCRIKVIHKPNGGLSDARNAGLAVATGEYCAFVDSDDLLHPDYIGDMLEAAGRYGALLVACDLSEFPDGEVPAMQFDKATALKSAAAALEELTSGVGVRAVAWNKLYHRTLLENEHFPVGRHHEDEFFTYRIIHKAGSVAWVAGVRYFYRQRAGSIMDHFSLKRLDALDAYLQRIALFETAYPDLCTRDKASFCAACCMFYAGGFSKGYENMPELKRWILERRKHLHITASQWLRFSCSQKLFAFGSRFGLGLVGRYLAWRQHG